MNPAFRDFSFTPKWIGLYFIGAVLGLLAWLPANRSQIRIDSGLFYSLATLVLVYCLSAVLNWPGFYFTHLLDWSCFFLITFSIASNREKDELLWFLSVGFYSSSLLLLLMKGVNFFGWSSHLNIPKDPFNQNNMAAEFLAISIFFQFYWCRARRFLILKSVFLGWSLVVFYQYQSRSAAIALLVSFLITLLLRKEEIATKKNIGITLLLGVFVFAAFFPSHFSLDDSIQDRLTEAVKQRQNSSAKDETKPGERLSHPSFYLLVGELI